MIYLDHAATTPVDPRVAEAMRPYLTEIFGNPSSVHGFGRKARSAVEQAREEIASFLHADPRQLLFTSSGTEADNLALIGTAIANREKGKHIITSSIEHHAVLNACERLEQLGFEVTYLPVDDTGLVRIADVEQAIRPDTILLSIMYVNNEVGTVQPVEAIGQLARENGILFHTDAVQAFGLFPVDLAKLPVDLVTVSAHKLNGPKGVGALYVSRGVAMAPLMLGGSQERNRRAGTENVAGIVGFAEAVKIARGEMAERRNKYEELRRTAISHWTEAGVQFTVNGHAERYAPHILNVSFPGTDTETMLMNLDLAGIAAASGSACSSGSLEVSHVLTAMCVGDARSRSAIRFSFGTTNSVDEVKQAARKTAEIVKRLTHR